MGQKLCSKNMEIFLENFVHPFLSTFWINYIKMQVRIFLEFSSFLAKEFHLFPRSSQGILNQGKCNAQWEGCYTIKQMQSNLLEMQNNWLNFSSMIFLCSETKCLAYLTSTNATKESLNLSMYIQYYNYMDTTIQLAMQEQKADKCYSDCVMSPTFLLTLIIEIDLKVLREPCQKIGVYKAWKVIIEYCLLIVL